MRLFFIGGALLVAADCELAEPCDRYVDYMCSCHVTASECDQLRAQLSGADVATQDQCEIDLANQRGEDGDNGLVCGDTGS